MPPTCTHETRLVRFAQRRRSTNRHALSRGNASLGRLFSSLPAIALLAVSLAASDPFGPSGSVSVTPTITPRTPSPAPPSPVVGILPPPPTNCPTSPPLDTVTAQPGGFSQPVQMYGHSPVWIPDGYIPQGQVSLNLPGTPNPNPSISILWEVGPGQNPAVAVHVTNERTGDLGWWSSDTSRSESPVLDFGGDPIDAVAGEYNEFHSALYLYQAGCYRLDVTWKGSAPPSAREWYTIFSVGGNAASA